MFASDLYFDRLHDINLPMLTRVVMTVTTVTFRELWMFSSVLGPFVLKLNPFNLICLQISSICAGMNVHF